MFRSSDDLRATAAAVAHPPPAASPFRSSADAPAAAGCADCATNGQLDALKAAGELDAYRSLLARRWLHWARDFAAPDAWADHLRKSGISVPADTARAFEQARRYAQPKVIR